MTKRTTEGSTDPYRVLIVDDEPQIRKALKWMLYSDEYQVHESESGLEALQVLRQAHERRGRVDHSFDVVVTDINMPYMSGHQLLQEIRASYDIEVILLTGHASVEGAVEAMKAGAFDYLTKPLNSVDECVRRITQAGRMKRLRAENNELRRLREIQEIDRATSHPHNKYEETETSQDSKLDSEGHTSHQVTGKKAMGKKETKAHHEERGGEYIYTPESRREGKEGLFSLHQLINLSLPFKESLNSTEESLRHFYLLEVLKQKGNISAAARHAGVDRANFKRLLKRYKVTLPF